MNLLTLPRLLIGDTSEDFDPGQCVDLRVWLICPGQCHMTLLYPFNTDSMRPTDMVGPHVLYQVIPPPENLS